jgi:hypothetical protein
MSADVAEVPLCSSDGTAGADTVQGFRICSGTSGACAGKAGTTAPIANNETVQARLYNNGFNNVGAYKLPMYFYGTPPALTAGTVGGVSLNPCLSVGVPVAADLRPGAPVPAWNQTPFTTATGCCATAAQWNVSSSMNASRRTRLSPMTTASAPGKQDAKNMLAALQYGLGGMTKTWGYSPGAWMHGGVSATNTGMWTKSMNGGKAFTVKDPYKNTWTQDTMLWCRMTGDNYDPSKDPYGSINVAGPGSFVASKTYMGAKYGLGNKDKQFKAAQDKCGNCNQGTLHIPVGTDDSGVPNKYKVVVEGNVVATDGAACENPMMQFCSNLPLTTEVMEGPSRYVNGNFPSGSTYGNTTHFGHATGYTNPVGRVGGCFATRDLYGPGKFSVLVHLPPTAPATSSDPLCQPEFPMVDPYTGQYYGVDASRAPSTAVRGGRGYVFSMWTFGYTEAYGVVEPTSSAILNPAGSAQIVSGDNVDIVNATPFNYPAQFGAVTSINSKDGTWSLVPNAGPVEMTDGSSLINEPLLRTPLVSNIMSGDPDDGFYATHNHEIDIEIPSNTSQAQGPGMASVLGLNTANFNTWMTDTDEYSAGVRTLYQQVQATAPPGQFFASVGPDDDENTFHEFSFVWYVDPDEETMAITASSAQLAQLNSKSSSNPIAGDAGCGSFPAQPQSKSYVAFYRDGVEISRTHRFVPRRSGRVIIGLWPAWWGSNYQPLTYNHMYAKIARLDFVPQCDITNTPFPGGALVTNAAQMYDQVFPVPTTLTPKYSSTLIVPGLTNNEIFCGFAQLGNPPPDASSGLQWWVYLLIALAAAIVIVVAVTVPVVLKQKADAQKAAAAANTVQQSSGPGASSTSVLGTQMSSAAGSTVS